MHAQDFQEPNQHIVDKISKETIPSENKIQNEEIITWRIPIKRYIKEWDIHWRMPNNRKQDTNGKKTNKRYQVPKRELGSKQTKPSANFHDGTKHQKEKAWLSAAHTW